MNPLSPFTYYRRHKSQALLLVGLIAALTLGVYSMVSLLDATLGNLRYYAHHLSRMSRVSTSEGPMALLLPGQTSAGGTLDSGLASQIRAHPDVAAVLPENGLYVGVPMGVVVPFPVLGVRESDLPLVMEVCDLRLKAGRLNEPRTNEIILSEELARALDLEVGDRISYTINPDYYQAIATELTLVGILESVPSAAGPEVRAGFVSYEYLDSHERYQPRATNWLIIPHPGRRVAVNEFASNLMAKSSGGTSGQLQTLESELECWEQGQQIADTLYRLVDGVVAVAAALIVSMVHRIAVARRLPEFGLLHANGYQKRRLVTRLVLEIAVITGVGWATGLLCARALMLLLKNTFFAAQGWSMDLTDLAPLLYTLPIPIVVVGWINVSVSRTLNHLDPVAIVERGRLSMEKAGGRRGRSQAPHSSHRPLSSLVFIARHRRRSTLLLTTIGLMILGVASQGFLHAMEWDALSPYFMSYSSHAAIASPGYSFRAITPDVITQIRAHPAVAQAIPVKSLSMVANLPLFGELIWMPVYAAREQDLPILLDVYGLHLREGELVQPRSGQVILTNGLARNRGLRIGNTIGYPVHERDSMPTEMAIVGLLESARPALVDRAGYNVPPTPRWIGFASYEFVDGHERYAGTPEHLLVIPVKGRESEMEAWLEATIASPRVKVDTLGTSYRFWRGTVQMIQAINAISVTILTVVASLGLTILNTIFFTQRRDEFGILHAAGHGQAKLVIRALRESLSLTAAAWVAGAAICVAGLWVAQATVYAPLGTSLYFYNPTPWLFTLPIPIAVVAASAGTIGWTLSRLDPVAVIERR